MEKIPIKFYHEMVKDILEDIKTQTRRPVKFSIDWTDGCSPVEVDDQHLNDFYQFDSDDGRVFDQVTCPFGKPGDVLLVKETFPELKDVVLDCGIKLLVKRVWVERVQDISEDDASKEGVKYESDNVQPGYYLYDGSCHVTKSPVESFRTLWDSIYGTWDDNVWVWCCEFERIALDSE